ncbi:hypothetical protein GCM10028794_17830 [Silanimonas algicola]
MMSRVSSAALFLVALIHLLPLPGVLGGEVLVRLYGIPVENPDLALLLRHRAVLFGLLGVGMIASVAWPAWRPAAYVAAFVSVLSFLALAALENPAQPAIQRVVIADVIALVLLVIGAWAEWRARQPG